MTKSPSLALEKYWPYVLAVLVTALWIIIKAPFPEEPSALLGASGGASAVLVGFLATAKAVLLSLSSTEVFKTLKEKGCKDLIYRYLFEAITSGIIFLVVAIFGFFVISGNVIPPSGYAGLWIFTGFLALFLYIRFTQILFTVLSWA